MSAPVRAAIGILFVWATIYGIGAFGYLDFGWLSDTLNWSARIRVFFAFESLCFTVLGAFAAQLILPAK